MYNIIYNYIIIFSFMIYDIFLKHIKYYNIIYDNN